MIPLRMLNRSQSFTAGVVEGAFRSPVSAISGPRALGKIRCGVHSQSDKQIKLWFDRVDVRLELDRFVARSTNRYG